MGCLVRDFGVEIGVLMAMTGFERRKIYSSTILVFDTKPIKRYKSLNNFISPLRNEGYIILE